MDFSFCSSFLPVFWYVIFAVVQGCMSASDCDSSETVACREEFEILRSNRDRYLYSSDQEALADMCSKQAVALRCVSSFAGDCLPPEEREAFRTLTRGSDRFFEEFCPDDSPLQRRYLEHSACIKNVSGSIDECHDEYQRAQNLIDEDDTHDNNLKQKTCCIYLEYIECCRNVTSSSCGEEAGGMVGRLWRLLGGAYLNELCQPFENSNAGGCWLASGAPERGLSGPGVFRVFLPVVAGSLRRHLWRDAS